ncbi:MAG TPA: hypothetical protein VGB61_15695, partial [Pyrinomonadaceae bacterium]
ANSSELVTMSWELADFVAALKMGEFYSKQIVRLLDWDRLPIGAITNDPEQNARFRYVDEHLDKAYREHLNEARHQVIELVIELLRFQQWEARDRTEK